MKRLTGLMLAAFILMPAGHIYAKSNDVVVQQIIQESIQTYPGNCPCPYNLDRAGRKCGKRSAYSRPGGASPLCYPADVTPEMVTEYLKRHVETKQ